MIQEPLVQVSCAVCGGDERRVICTAEEVRAHLVYLRLFHRRRLRHPDATSLADRADFTQDYATDIVACRECGLVFRSPRPSAEAIARAYAHDHYGLRRLASMFDAQVELYRPKARALRRWLRPGARVIEVGSFVGGFLQAGREQGWEMLGVDPGEEVDAFCGERELPVFRGTLPDLAAGGWKRPVDCIAIWNAFDQLADPEPTLAAAHQLLRPGGLLALRVPNGDCFRRAVSWSRRLPGAGAGWLRALMAWNNLLAFPYLHGYSVRTLDWLLSWQQFERVAARRDTLCRLADGDTKRWAAWEERVLKWAARRLGLAPWVDVYYRQQSGKR